MLFEQTTRTKLSAKKQSKKLCIILNKYHIKYKYINKAVKRKYN